MPAVLLMPGETDQHFRVADNAAELSHLRRESAALNRELRIGLPGQRFPTR